MYERFSAALTRRPAPMMTLMASLMLATAGLVAGCASATATCAVRHRYAIVILQDGVGNPRARFVTSFRLTVRYPSGSIEQRQVFTRIALRAADGGNPPLIIRTYRVGRAASCKVDELTAHR